MSLADLECTFQLCTLPMHARVPTLCAAAVQGNEDVADNLRHQTRGKDLLVLWLDCDREGEAIGFEV